MNTQTTVHADQTPFTEAFAALPDRDALRLLKTLAERFSGCGYSFDKLEAGIEECAVCCAEDEGFRGDDLAYRYLSAPDRFGPAYASKVMVRLTDAAFHGEGVYGG